MVILVMEHFCVVVFNKRYIIYFLCWNHTTRAEGYCYHFVVIWLYKLYVGTSLCEHDMNNTKYSLSMEVHSWPCEHISVMDQVGHPHQTPRTRYVCGRQHRMELNATGRFRYRWVGWVMYVRLPHRRLGFDPHEKLCFFLKNCNCHR